MLLRAAAAVKPNPGAALRRASSIAGPATSARAATAVSAVALTRRQSRQRDDFAAQLQQSGHLYQALAGQPSAASGKVLDNCINIFTMALVSPLPLAVLGPTRALWNPLMLRNFGPAFASGMPPALIRKALDNPRWSDPAWKGQSVEERALAALIEESDGKPVHSGSVLFDLMAWSIAHNDAFVLGCCVAGKEIHLPLTDAPMSAMSGDILFDGAANRPRVLGRELPLLATAGMQRVVNPYPSTGTVLIADSEAPYKLDLAPLLAKLNNLKTEGDVRAAMQPLDKV